MKILVVNMNYLGDALMTTPAIAALRRAHPDARIDTIAGAAQGYAAADILAMDPDIDQVIPRSPGGAAARCLQLAQVLRRGRYDAAVVLPSIAAYDTTVRLAGPPIKVMTPQLQGRVHLADHLLQAVEPLAGKAAAIRRLVLRIPPEAVRSAAKLLSRRPRAGARLVALNLGATRPQKRWPKRHFADLAAALATDYNVVLLGGPVPSDCEYARDILEAVGSENLVDLTGKTTLPDLAGVISACDALVTADSGAMHIASAVGTPLIALFGSTDPAVTGPYGDSPARVLYKSLACAPCGKHPTCAGRFDCLISINPAEVLAALGEILSTPAEQTLAARAG